MWLGDMFGEQLTKTEVGDEQSAASGGDKERRICLDGGWEATEVGCEWAAFRRLGDLSLEGVTGGSGTDLCVAVERMVGANYSEITGRRKELGSGGKQICI